MTSYQLTPTGFFELMEIIRTKHPQGSTLIQNPDILLYYSLLAESNMNSSGEPSFELAYGTTDLLCNYDYELSENATRMAYLH